MPSVSQLKSAYGIHVGKIYDPPGVLLQDVEMKEIALKPYHLYQYPLKMIFLPLRDLSLAAFQKFIERTFGGTKDILATVNYYRCSLGVFRIHKKGKFLIVQSVGVGKNISPTHGY